VANKIGFDRRREVAARLTREGKLVPIVIKHEEMPKPRVSAKGKKKKQT
jgi:hypothetical protein